jgi:hypothetical protein
MARPVVAIEVVITVLLGAALSVDVSWWRFGGGVSLAVQVLVAMHLSAVTLLLYILARVKWGRSHVVGVLVPDNEVFEWRVEFGTVMYLVPSSLFTFTFLIAWCDQHEGATACGLWGVWATFGVVPAFFAFLAWLERFPPDAHDATPAHVLLRHRRRAD